MIFIKNIFTILGILLTIFYVLFMVCLYQILKKEKIKEWYAFIPVYNIYLYLKICKLPFWTFFVPVVNIIVLVCSIFRLCKQYRMKRVHCYLAIIFPCIYLPYVAFSKLESIDKIYDTMYIKNVKDIELLEKKLENDYQEALSDNIDINKNNKVSENNIDDIISQIDNSNFKEEFFDEIIYDDVNDKQDRNMEFTSEKSEEIIGLDDTPINELSIETIDVLDNNIAIASSIEKTINTDIKEYETIGPSSEAIAFGGEQKIENTYASQAKTEEFKCPRCGSSLIGATDYCPGCGSKL